MYGFTITSYDGDNCIRLGKKDGKVDATIFSMLEDWQKEKKKLYDGKITHEEYMEWKCHYPSSSESPSWQKNTSLSEEMTKQLFGRNAE